jgi:hypothetical protein
MDYHEEYCENNNIYSDFLQLQFENEQLRFENERLNKIIINKNETIKLLETTLLENSNWEYTFTQQTEKIDNDNDNDNDDILLKVKDDIPENKIITVNTFQNNSFNHINTLLIKKGIYKNTRLIHQYIGNKNITIK